MRLVDFQRLPEESPEKPEEGDRFLMGGKVISQKLSVEEEGLVTLYVVNAVKKRPDGSVKSFEFSPCTIRLEK